MEILKKNKKIILLITAFTVCWFSLYSIINFHQHRLFGKELKYHVYPSLCKKEENIIFNITKQNNISFNKNILPELLKQFSYPSNLTINFDRYSIQLTFMTGSIASQIICCGQDRLRGPPSLVC